MYQVDCFFLKNRFKLAILANIKHCKSAPWSISTETKGHPPPKKRNYRPKVLDFSLRWTTKLSHRTLNPYMAVPSIVHSSPAQCTALPCNDAGACGFPLVQWRGHRWRPLRPGQRLLSRPGLWHWPVSGKKVQRKTGSATTNLPLLGQLVTPYFLRQREFPLFTDLDEVFIYNLTSDDL